MTKDQEKEVIRVCGKDYDPSDIPPAYRDEDNPMFDQMEEMDHFDGIVTEIESVLDDLTDMFGEGGKEEVKEFYGRNNQE